MRATLPGCRYCKERKCARHPEQTRPSAPCPRQSPHKSFQTSAQLLRPYERHARLPASGLRAPARRRLRADYAACQLQPPARTSKARWSPRYPVRPWQIVWRCRSPWNARRWRALLVCLRCRSAFSQIAPYPPSGQRVRGSPHRFRSGCRSGASDSCHGPADRRSAPYSRSAPRSRPRAA